MILKEAIALCDDVVNLLLHAVELWDRKCLDMVPTSYFEEVGEKSKKT